MPPAPQDPGRRLVARRRQAAARRVLPHRARERARHARRAEGSRRHLRERAHARRLGRRAARQRARSAPKAAKRLPVIKAARGDADQGHAFAIVGYTRDGLHRSQLVGRGVGARRLRRAAVRGLAAQRDGLLGRAARRRDRRARRGCRRRKSLRVERSGRARRLEQRDAGRSRDLAVRHQHGERRRA